MKIALIVRRFTTQGGTERFVHGLAHWLVRQGHDVHLFCHEVATEATPLEGATIHLHPTRARGRIAKLRAQLQLAQHAKPSDFEHVATFLRTPNASMYRAGGGCHQSWLAARAQWQTLHLPLPAWVGIADRMETRMDQEAVQTAALVIVNSHMAKLDLVKEYQANADKLHLIRNGVDLQRFHPEGPVHPAVEQSAEPVIGFLGSGFARKGLTTAIQATASIPNARLMVMGGDPNPGRFGRLATQLQLGDRIRFLGADPRPERFLRGLSVMILPTRYDPFANSCLEAMASGVPVLTSAHNGAAEVLPEPWMSIANPHDHNAFAAALDRALQTEGLGETCRRIAETLPAQRAFQEFSLLAQSNPS